MHKNIKGKTIGDILEIDEMDYLVTPQTVVAFGGGAELVPLQRLFDKKEFFVAREKFLASPITDHVELNRRS